MGKREWAALAAAISVFLGLGLWFGRTKAPWCDEAWFANPAYNLAFHGHMGTNVLEPSGHFLNAYLTGIRERTYIVTPNHLLGLAAWFKVAGFSLLSQRVYSLLWGALAVAGLFALLRTTFAEPAMAMVSAGLLSIDFVFVWGSADGRMEASSCALALWSLVAYLYGRERNLTRAVVVSQGLLAAAAFVHPYAFLLGLAVPLCAWRLDRDRLNLRHVAAAAVPYLVFAGLWGLYILESPQAFVAQFFANANGPSSQRWKALLMPWKMVWLEIARQVSVQCSGGLWTGVRNDFGVLICLIQWSAVAYLWCARRRLDTRQRIFGWAFAATLGSLTFLNGFKAFCYLLYLHPFYCAALAFLLLDWWGRGTSGRIAAGTLAGLLILLQGARAGSHIRADEYGREYLPAAMALREDLARGRSVMAPSSMGFGVGFAGFEDDRRLGLHTGRRPDVLVMDRSYRVFACRFAEVEPETYRRVEKVLTEEYRLRRRFGSFWILDRRGADEPPPLPNENQAKMPPGIEAAEALFRRVTGGPVEHCGG